MIMLMQIFKNILITKRQMSPVSGGAHSRPSVVCHNLPPKLERS